MSPYHDRQQQREQAAYDRRHAIEHQRRRDAEREAYMDECTQMIERRKKGLIVEVKTLNPCEMVGIKLETFTWNR